MSLHKLAYLRMQSIKNSLPLNRVGVVFILSIVLLCIHIGK
jgi:hypothetical protein